MENLDTLENKLCELRWEKQYEEALRLFRSMIHGHYPPVEIKEHGRLCGAVLDCLRESGKMKQAVSFLTRYLALEPGQIKDPVLLKNIGWNLYFALDEEYYHQAPVQPADEDFVSGVIRRLHETAQASLFGKLLFQFTDYLHSVLQDHGAILSLLDAFPESAFSAEPEPIRITMRGEQKEIMLASELEKRYVWLTKAAFLAGLYDRCLQSGETALRNIRNFHHGNHHWIARRMALCWKQKGNLGRAVHEMERLLQQRHEWFIEAELARLYFETGSLPEAMKAVSGACRKQGYSPYKTSLFKFAADLFTAADKPRLACLSLHLAVMARQEEGWKVPAAMEQALQDCNIPPDARVQDIYNTLIAEISEQFPAGGKDDRQEASLRGEGKITRILHEGHKGDGFITSDKGVGIYFRMSQCKIPPAEVREGLPVSFVAREVERNNKKVWNAIKVYPVSP